MVMFRRSAWELVRVLLLVALGLTGGAVFAQADVPASPTLTVYQDLDEHDGQYLTISVGHTFDDVWKPAADVTMSVDLAASLAWGSRKHNHFYYGPGSGWTDATVSLGLPPTSNPRN